MPDEEDDGRPRPNKAKMEDEFLKHPHSGASIRNPLLDKSRSAPILFQDPEFKHNCLDDALPEYQCISVSEAGFKEMMRTGNFLLATRELQAAGCDSSTVSPVSPPTSPLARAALSSLNKLPSGYDFVVTVRKSAYVPRGSRRREEQKKQTNSQVIEKLNIEVSDDGGPGVKVEDVREGLVSVWNRANPAFQVRQGDRILKANLAGFGSVPGTPQQIVEELEGASDQVRMSIRRAGRELRRPSKAGLSRRGSKASVTSAAVAAIATM